MLNCRWAGRNPTKGCSADWRRRMWMNVAPSFGFELWWNTILFFEDLGCGWSLNWWVDSLFCTSLLRVLLLCWFIDFFGYWTMLFNWLESNVAYRLNILWKELLVHFSQIFSEATEENRDRHSYFGALFKLGNPKYELVLTNKAQPLFWGLNTRRNVRFVRRREFVFELHRVSLCADFIAGRRFGWF
jgi:hypothetical protein